MIDQSIREALTQLMGEGLHSSLRIYGDSESAEIAYHAISAALDRDIGLWVHYLEDLVDRFVVWSEEAPESSDRWIIGPTRPGAWVQMLKDLTLAHYHSRDGRAPSIVRVMYHVFRTFSADDWTHYGAAVWVTLYNFLNDELDSAWRELGIDIPVRRRYSNRTRREL